MFTTILPPTVFSEITEQTNFLCSKTLKYQFWWEIQLVIYEFHKNIMKLWLKNFSYFLSWYDQYIEQYN